MIQTLKNTLFETHEKRKDMQNEIIFYTIAVHSHTTFGKVIIISSKASFRGFSSSGCSKIEARGGAIVLGWVFE